MSTAGFILPKVNFLNITLDGGKDLLKITNDPHIKQQGEEINEIDFTFNESGATPPSKMKVDLLLSINVGFDQSSCNLYSMFFKNFDDVLQAYLKIRIFQSTDVSINQVILNNPAEYFRPGGIYDTGGPALHELLQEKTLEFSEYEGSGLDLDQNSNNDERLQIEKKYDSDGNIIYVFPYRVDFEVSESQGGTKVQNLTYFAFAYIDFKYLFLEEDPFFEEVPLPQEIIENLSTGQITLQTVIQGGSTKTFGQVFYITQYDENGIPLTLESYVNPTIWTGPTHYHGPQDPGPNGYVGYMTGENMSGTSQFLTEQTVLNGVIQDFREVVELERIDFNYSLFSNSWFNQKTTEKLYDNLKGLKELANQDNQYTQNTSDIEMAIVKSFTTSPNQAIFTDFYTAMDGSGNIRFAFGLNFKEILKQYSIFPRLIDNIFENSSPSEINSFLNQSLIKDFRIYRDRVYKENIADVKVDLYEKIENENSKLVCVTDENELGVIQAKSFKINNETVGTIKEINLQLPDIAQATSYKSKVKFYTGTDVGIPNDGDYIYTLQFVMKDPIISWMEQKILKLEEILYGNQAIGNTLMGLLDYVEDAKRDPNYFNLYTNRFTQKGIDALKGKYGNNFAGSKIVDFFEVLNSFSTFDKNFFGLYNFLYSISSTGFGSPSGALKAFQILENTYKKVLDLFATASKYKKPEDSQHVESQYAAGSNPKREFVVKKKFSSEIKGEVNHLTGYDYLSINNTLEEDSSIGTGIKSMIKPNYDLRINLETQKYFPNQEYDIEIPKKPLSYTDAEDLGPAQIYQKQGPILNPDDNINFTKNAFLSPSIVNFANSTSQNLLNNGNLRTDIKNLNNVLMNIIRVNSQNKQKLDFPGGGASVATGVTSNSTIKKNGSTESKYDLTTILSGRQTTVAALETLNVGSSDKETNSGIMGGFGAPITNMAESEIGFPSPDPNDNKDIYSTNIDPTDLLLTITQQNLFETLSDELWTWEYYTQNFDETFFKEFYIWNVFGGQQANPNSPLKRAPNQVKSFMSNLDYTKEYSAEAFSELVDQFKTKHPFVFDKITNPEDAYDLIGPDGKPTALSERKIIYQNPDFLSFFMLNFKNIVKIEALIGYDLDSNGDISINSPKWTEMTEDIYNAAQGLKGNIMCRLVSYEKPLYGIRRYDFTELPIYNEYFIIDFSAAGPATLQTEEGALFQQEQDTSPFGEPDSQEFLPGGQTMEQAEALVGAEGGAMGISIATGLSAGAVTELGMTGMIGGAAGGVDVGTGAGMGGMGGQGGGMGGQGGGMGGQGGGMGGQGGGTGSGPLFGVAKALGNNTDSGNVTSEALQEGGSGSDQMTSGFMQFGSSNEQGDQQNIETQSGGSGGLLGGNY